MAHRKALGSFRLATLLLAAAVVVIYTHDASATTIPIEGANASASWWPLGILFLFASMSSFGWSRFVPETIGHDTERLNAPGVQDEPQRTQLPKFLAEEMFRFSAALGTVEFTDPASPAPHVLILAKGCELSGARSGWAGILDTNGSGIRVVSLVEDGQSAAMGDSAPTALADVPELVDYLTLGKPCTIEPSIRKQQATKKLFGEPKRGTGLLVPLRSGGDVLGIYYWLGIPPDLTAENVRVIALSNACSLLAARIDGLALKERLHATTIELTTLTHLGELVGTATREPDWPKRVLALVHELHGIQSCRLFLADDRGRELALAARISDLAEIDSPRALKVGSEGVAAQAAAKRETIYVPEVDQHTGYVAFSEGVACELCIPLIRDGRLLGVLDLESADPNGLSAQDRTGLLQSAVHLSAVVENYRLVTQESMHVRKQSVLANIGRAALTSPNPSEFLDHAVQAIANSFDFGHVYLFLRPEQKDFLVLRARSFREEPALPLHFRASTAKGILGYTARTATSLLANDVSKEALYFAKLPGMSSELCLPISANGKLLGVIDILDRKKGAFSLDDVALLEAASDFLAAAIERHASLHLARGRASQFALLDRVTRALLGSKTVAELLDRVYAELAAVLDLKRITLLTRAQNSQVLRVVANHVEEGSPSIDVGTEFSLEGSRLADVLTSDGPIVVSNFEHQAGDGPLAPVEAQLNEMGVRSLILLPVTYDGETQAVFALCSSKAGALREEHIELLEPVAQHFGIALKGACGGRLVGIDEVPLHEIRSDDSVAQTVPARIIGEILSQTHKLLLGVSGEKPSDLSALQTSLENIEQEATKVSKLLDAAAAKVGENRSIQTIHDSVTTEHTGINRADFTASPLRQESSRRVLVLDDQESILDIVVDILTSAGHTVSTSSSLSEAINALEASPFDLVLSDWSLDGENAHRLIQAAVQAGVPIVITTGWRGEVDEVALSHLGVKAVLRKPFDVKKLLDAVAAYACAPSRMPRL